MAPVCAISACGLIKVSWLCPLSFNVLDSACSPQDAAKGMTETELNVSLAKLLASLGDRYTRYLPPAKYATIVQVLYMLYGMTPPWY